MTAIPQLTTNDDGLLPAIGFGTYPLTGSEGVDAIASAIDAGYRLIDTAVNYENEAAVGEAVRGSGVPRGELLLQSKLPGRDHGYDSTLRSFDGTVERLGVDVLDSYLIHWPNPSVDRYVEAWRAMVELQRAGRVRHIGVSNFTRTFIERIAADTGVLPSVNQIELHPAFPQEALVDFHAEHGILTQAWSPLGKASAPYDEPVVAGPAERLGVTPAQVLLRWHVQRGVLPLPKSGTPERQRQNIDVFGFELTDDEVAAITALGRPDGRLFDADPNTHEEQ